MKNRHLVAVSLVALTLSGTSLFAQGRSKAAGSVHTSEFGDLGRLNVANGDVKGASKAFARGYMARFGAAGSEDFNPRWSVTDELGQVHVRLSQTVNGLPVVGAELIVHSDAATSVVRGVNGEFAPDAGLPRAAKVRSTDAVANAAKAFGLSGWKPTGDASLTYIITEDGTTHLAWSADVAYVNEQGDQLDRVFTDAVTGEALARHPQLYYAKYRKTYTASNGTTLPGTLLSNEGTRPTDTAAAAAYDNGGLTYDYYFNRHGRDSYDNAGASLVQTVHYSTNYNNAYWNGTQMVYGDGDGVQFTSLSKSLDVCAHELTHAVTERTAGLVYKDESGGLNEAMSDIFGTSTEAYARPTSWNWMIGEDVYTPATAGDALRYMNDPAKAGDKDYYPTRYIGTSDNGGVHTNSGVANLAYQLLVSGGTHPRATTSTAVTGIGFAAAEKIFYRALTVYATSSTNYRLMRNYTLQAATDLYGSTSQQYTSVGNAWTAVGDSWTKYSASLASGGSSLQPSGTYYTTTTTGYQTGQLFGPAGTDFDLYLQKWNGTAWANVASAATAATNETVQYSGAAGYYRWNVVSYSGTGTFSLYTNTPK